MSLNIGNGINNYNALFASIQKSGKQKTKASSQMDFASMGTIRNAVIQQNVKDQMNARFQQTEDDIPTYTEKYTVCGVDFTDNPDGYKVIVPLPDKVKGQLDEFIKENFERQGYVSKENLDLTEKTLKFKKEYLSTLKQKDRPSAQWTMNQYLFNETDKYADKIRTLDPKWDWGQPVKKEVLNQVFAKKLDVSV